MLISVTFYGLSNVVGYLKSKYVLNLKNISLLRVIFLFAVFENNNDLLDTGSTI